MGLPVADCRAVLTSDSDPIEVWLVTNNDPVPKPEAETADRLQLPLPPQPPEQPAQQVATEQTSSPATCNKDKSACSPLRTVHADQCPCT